MIELDEDLGYSVKSEVYTKKTFEYTSTIGDFNYYTFTNNFKISHQDWLDALDTNDVFYDVSLNRKGQNRNLLRYINDSYDCKLKIEANLIQDEINTLYECYSPEFYLVDYDDEVATTGLSDPLAEFEFWTLAGVQLPDNVVLENETVNVKVKFKQLTPSLDFDCIIYEESGVGNENDLVYLPILNKYTDSGYIIFETKNTGKAIISARLFAINDFVPAVLKVYFGTRATLPTTEAHILALNDLTLVNEFTLITGTVNKIFVVAIPTSYNLVSVLDNFNWEVVGEFEQIDTIEVDGVECKILVYENNIPYANSQNLNITII
jgi:hypothetical protein